MNRLLLLLVCLTMSFSACQEISKTKRLKLAHGLSVTHPVHEAMQFLADEVAKNSEGQLLIDIYPSEQLGKERELVELLQIGSIAITKVSSGVLENFSPNIRVLGLPYVFRDRKHLFSVLDGPIGQQLLEEPRKYRLKGLCYFDAGFRSFYTIDKAIEHPDDLQGLKIRVMPSKTATEMVNTMGGSANPIPWGELYSALQQGVVDGAENNPPSFLSSRHYEVCKYYALNEHTALPDVLVMSTEQFDKLNEEEQAWLMKAVNDAKIYEREVWAKAEKEALDIVQENGVTIIRPQKDPFMQKVAKVLDAYQDEPAIYKLIQEIQAIP
ncbi:MAG: TRAP transporter substrate-binding protein [Bacteroidota bacterium]